MLMMNVKHKVFVLGAALLLLVNLQANAGPTLNDPETWNTDPAGGTADWSPTGPAVLSNPGSGAPPGTVGDRSNYLKIDFGSQSEPALPEFATITTVSGSRIGSMVGLTLKFSFYNAPDVLPASSMVYIHSSYGAGSDWTYLFANTSAGGWQDKTISLVYDPLYWSWSGGDNDPAQFALDLANVNAVGLTISRKFVTDAQTYGLDDWGYYESTAVPEPGVVCVLMSALLSMALIFRKRIRFVRA
jgi:hypothetical protein